MVLVALDLGERRCKPVLRKRNASATDPIGFRAVTDHKIAVTRKSG